MLKWKCFICLLCVVENVSSKDEQNSDYFSLIKKKFSPLPRCTWDFNYNIPKAVVSGLCFFLAVFVLVCGYKHRRISFGIIGFSTVSILTYYAFVSEANYSKLINIGVSLACGVLASLLTAGNLYCGYFLTGFLAGILLGFISLLVYVSCFGMLNSIALPCVIIGIISLVQTFVTMWWRHRLLIVSICLFASAAMSIALDYFVEDLFLMEYVEMRLFYNRTPTMCWWSYVMFALWPLFFIIGMLVQCLCTGKERQKESYLFVYKRKHTTNQLYDDQNHLIRYGSDDY